MYKWNQYLRESRKRGSGPGLEKSLNWFLDKGPQKKGGYPKKRRPNFSKKKFNNIVGEKFKRSGYRKKGIRPRLSKKETLKNKIRRRKSAERSGTFDPDEDDRFPFHKDDLKYKHIKEFPKENSNAVIFFMMDTSGSMSKSKKFMARSFFFLLYHFLRYKYENVDLFFISHDIKAKEVNEDDFLKEVANGR